jgi:hypothetical protein
MEDIFFRLALPEDGHGKEEFSSEDLNAML